MPSNEHIPIIDISSLVNLRQSRQQVALAIHQACTQHGFFYISHHGVSVALQERLERLSEQFFALDLETKMQIAMSKAGHAWRGYFPVGNELTSGQADLKEGIYFGEELGQDHPMVKAQTPMHGANLFPEVPGFRETVLAYMQVMKRLGQQLMQGIAMSLNLEPDYFYQHYTRDPLILFRIFHYPPPAASSKDQNFQWGVGEHTDYGILTILKQDANGGLEIKSGERWIAAPPIPNTFVCNIGDMLEKMTGGYYRSTPHRVLNLSGKNRYSWPFFFDPNFNSTVQPLPMHNTATEHHYERWDHANIHSFQGSYGDYLLGKVGKVFPELKSKVLNSN